MHDDMNEPLNTGQKLNLKTLYYDLSNKTMFSKRPVLLMTSSFANRWSRQNLTWNIVQWHLNKDCVQLLIQIAIGQNESKKLKVRGIRTKEQNRGKEGATSDTN
jgi:hypothetical protein